MIELSATTDRAHGLPTIELCVEVVPREILARRWQRFGSSHLPHPQQQFSTPTPPELAIGNDAAALLHLLGIDHEQRTFKFQGSLLPLS